MIPKSGYRFSEKIMLRQKGRVAKVRIISTLSIGVVLRRREAPSRRTATSEMTPGAILRDALAALGLLRMRSVVDALLKRRDDVGKVFLDHLVDAEERRPADK